MHETETIEDELNVRSTDWVQTDRAGIRHVRLGGYAGAPTGELVATALGWVGTSWLMQPRREIWLPREITLEWAVHHLETAEGLGQDAPAWLPLSQPGANGMGDLIPLRVAPGHPRRWAKAVNGHTVMLIEAAGPAGAARYQVVIDSVVLTERDGMPVSFDDLVDALYTADMEVTP
jgi:hypothetical protein